MINTISAICLLALGVKLLVVIRLLMRSRRANTALIATVSRLRRERNALRGSDKPYVLETDEGQKGLTSTILP